MGLRVPMRGKFTSECENLSNGQGKASGVSADDEIDHKGSWLTIFTPGEQPLKNDVGIFLSKVCQKKANPHGIKQFGRKLFINEWEQLNSLAVKCEGLHPANAKQWH